MYKNIPLIETELADCRAVLQYLQNKTHTDVLLNTKDFCDIESRLENDELFLYHIKEVTYEEKAPRREAVENILGTFRNQQGINFVYLLLGSKECIDFYFGVALDKTTAKNNNVSNFAQYVLLPNIKGNFRGCDVEAVSSKARLAILDKLRSAKRCGILDGVPGLETDANGAEPENSFQGVDRLIDVMQGHNFGFAVIAKPYTDKAIGQLQENLFAVYDALLPLTKYTLQHTASHADNNSHSESVGFSRQASSNVQKTVGRNFIVGHTTSADKRDDKNNQVVASDSDSTTIQIDKSRNYGENISNSNKDDSKTANMSGSENHSINHAVNYSYTNTYSVSDAHSSTSNYQRTANNDKSKSANDSYQKTKNRNHESADSFNDAINEQLEVESKAAASWEEYIDKILLPRVERGLGKGLFLTSTYLFSDTAIEIDCLAQTAQSIYSGIKGNKRALKFIPLQNDSLCLKSLKNLQIPVANKYADTYCDAALSNQSAAGMVYAASWFSTEELGILAGLPHKDVVGLALRKEVEYGLNVATKDATDEQGKFELGTLIKGGADTNIPVYLNKSKLNKHIFIAGVTGSGKTVTCQNILLNSNLPFLVIEPAKTEYRILKKELCPDLLIFTPGNQQLGPLFLNPFELFPGEAISSRVDMLMATIEASLHMEAAIPQILEEAMYEAYKVKGWNIRNNKWHGKDEKNEQDGPFADGIFAFPTLSDYAKTVENIVDKKNFDERLRDEYLGTIRSLLAGLMVGAKGMMLNVERSVDFKDLVKRKVLIELEEIKSGKEKSLIMGFILTNLMQAVKYCYKQSVQEKQVKFQHITLVEEAHRLLSRFTQGDSLNKKQGVETFADMLAEVRKYGESLIIADQIPEKMTPEVLKNTNTKIVHRLFAQDDKDAIGNAIALEDEQKKFLSNLSTGRAIVFTEDWSKAAQLHITMKYKTDEADVLDEGIIKDGVMQYYAEPVVYKKGILKGLHTKNNVTLETVKSYFNCLWNDQAFDVLQAFIRNTADYSSNKDEDWQLLADYVQESLQGIEFEDYIECLYYRLNTVGDKCDKVDLRELMLLLSKKHVLEAKDFYLSLD